MAAAESTAHPISERDREELRRGKPISDCLPIQTDAGEIDEVSMDCAVCERPIPDRDTRVQVAQFGGTYQLRGWGCCRPCRTATPLVMRFHPDGRMTAPLPGRPNSWGSWRFLQNKKGGGVQSIRRHLRRLFMRD